MEFKHKIFLFFFIVGDFCTTLYGNYIENLYETNPVVKTLIQQGMIGFILLLAIKIIIALILVKQNIFINKHKSKFKYIHNLFFCLVTIISIVVTFHNLYLILTS